MNINAYINSTSDWSSYPLGKIQINCRKIKKCINKAKKPMYGTLSVQTFNVFGHFDNVDFCIC